MDTKEIKKTITDEFLSRSEVRAAYGITDQQLAEGMTFDDLFSSVSVESLLFYSVASALNVYMQALDRHKTDVSVLLAEQRAGSAAWYVWKAKQFRLGQALLPDTDTYSDEGLTESQIAGRQIIKHAAVDEPADRSIIYLKIAGESGGIRQPLFPSQLNAFKSYLNAFGYAGVRVSLINAYPDRMRLEMDIYYSPLLLDASGRRLDGTSGTPVQDAIRNYLNNLPFNGMYSNQALVDVLQNTPGVSIAEVKSVKSKHEPYTQWHDINAREVAYAGYYLIVEEDLILTFISDGQ
jgi:hypothetical protein